MKHRTTVTTIAAATLLAGVALAQTTRPAGEPTSRPDSQPAAPAPDHGGSDEQAVALAEATMEAMGGRAAWDGTRYLRWRFFGGRRHVWDKHTGRVRIEATDRSGEPCVMLMDLDTGDGRAWIGDEEVTEERKRRSLLDGGKGMWINDSYWLVMPYKLLDPGVTLRHVGAGTMEDDRPAQVIEMTFDGVGRTPQNKYRVFVADDTGLVEQWQFFEGRDDAEPRFTTPWHGWRRHGSIMLGGDRGTLGGEPASLDEIAVYQTLPASVFDSPDAVDWDAIETE